MAMVEQRGRAGRLVRTHVETAIDLERMRTKNTEDTTRHNYMTLMSANLCEVVGHGCPGPDAVTQQVSYPAAQS